MVAERHTPYRIFVVDDDAPFRYVVRILLEVDPTFEFVGEAANGRECLDQLDTLDREGRLPDAIVVDLDMPELPGCKTARILATRWPQLNVVIWTSYDVDIARRRVGREDAAVAYIQKGFPENLLSTLGDMYSDDARRRDR